MSLASAASLGVQGAWLLARGRADGLSLIENDWAGAARSFCAIAICLPSFICLRLMTWAIDGLPSHAAHALALDLLSYVIQWCGFAVLSHQLVGAMGLAERWPKFIAVWNWCAVVQYLMLVVFSVPEVLGVPALLAQAAQLFALGWALWLEWFAFRLVLDVRAVTAAWLVGVDLALSVVLATVGAGLTG